MTNSIPVSSLAYVVVVEDGGDGHPLVFETELHHPDTRENAEARQRAIGDRYGRTWIAECHILPDTERKPEPVTPFQVGQAVGSLEGRGPFFRHTALQLLRRFVREQEQLDG